jgi:hypothetical protein
MARVIVVLKENETELTFPDAKAIGSTHKLEIHNAAGHVALFDMRDLKRWYVEEEISN